MGEVLRKMEALLKREGLVAQDRPAFPNLEDLINYGLKDAVKTGRYVWFDMECIYDTKDYELILAGFEKKCGNKNQFEILSVYFDNDAEKAGIKIRVNGKEFEGGWSQQSDWVAGEFFAIVDEFNKVLKGRYVSLLIDQDYRAVYIDDRLVADELESLFKGAFDEWLKSE